MSSATRIATAAKITTNIAPVSAKYITWDKVKAVVDDINNYALHVDEAANIPINKLYKPDGSSYTVYVDATGALNINGNIIQNGEPYIVYAQEVRTKDDMIVMRDGAIAGLPASTYSGFRIKKYDGVSDLLLVAGNDGWGRIGEENSLQVIATRQDSPNANGIAYWNNDAKRFDTNSKFTITSDTLQAYSNGNSFYGLAATGTSGGARSIFSAGQEGFSNGFTVDYDGSAMAYKFLDGKIAVGDITADEKIHTDGNIKANQLISTVATGTAPISSQSLTKCNLNVEQVDSYDVQPGAYDSGPYILRNNSYGLGQTGSLTIITQVQLDDYTFGANGAMYRIDNPTGLRAGNYHVYIHRTATTNVHQTLKSTNVDTRVYQRYINNASGVTAWSQVWDSTNSNLSTVDWSAKKIIAAETVKGTTGIFTNLSANTFALHQDNTNGFINSKLTQVGNAIIFTDNTASAATVFDAKNNQTNAYAGFVATVNSYTSYAYQFGAAVSTTELRNKAVFGGSGVSTVLTNSALIELKIHTPGGDYSSTQMSISSTAANVNVDLYVKSTPVFRKAAAAMSTTIDFNSTTNYTKTLSTNETWGLANVPNDNERAIVVNLNMGETLYSITCASLGVTFYGDVNNSGVIQGLAANKRYFIGFFVESYTVIWVFVKENKA